MKRQCQQQRPDFVRIRHALMLVGIAVCVAFFLIVPTASSAVQSPQEYFTTWDLSPSYLQKQFDVAAAGDMVTLSSDEFQVISRILDRLQGAPSQWLQKWADDSVAFDSNLITTYQQECRSVQVIGDIVRVNCIESPRNVAAITSLKEIYAVQLLLEDSQTVWVVVPEIPAGLPVGRPLHQNGGASVILLHVSGEDSIKKQKEPILSVAARIQWWPQTSFGKLGMDYGLFQSVIDGDSLRAVESDAFYSSLSVSARQKRIPDGPLIDDKSLVALLDPASDWLRLHRGRQITLDGTARRIVKVTVESKREQKILGSDHYWEIFLFVPTPLLLIQNEFQETYPVVFCCTKLPQGMPVGEGVNERLKVTGFLFKRYRYITRRLNYSGKGAGEGRPQESPLLVGQIPVWVPAKQPSKLPRGMTWLPVLTAVALVGWIVKGFCQSRHRSPLKESLPDQIQLP
ncbi:MAG: hypothetical protein HOH16_11685 [Planctomycetaceae bacterium]|nr:hypothetical protein [Planctomycetaceae bacterium]